MVSADANSDLFFYFAASTGYDEVLLTTKSDNDTMNDGVTLSGWEFTKKLYSMTFRTARVFVDGSAHAESFMRGAIDSMGAANAAKSIRVTASVGENRACYCPPRVGVGR